MASMMVWSYHTVDFLEVGDPGSCGEAGVATMVV